MSTITIPQNPFQKAISLFDEMVAYETLWGMENSTQKVVGDLFRAMPGLPSSLLQKRMSEQMFLSQLYDTVRDFLSKLKGFSVSVHGAFQYPAKLRDAQYPLELFYYRGGIELAESRCISLVGARKATSSGVVRAKRLAKELVQSGFTIVSGLAAGIDTAAMSSAIENGGQTIGVIGTPINHVYPKENASLQERIAREFLLVSQVPFYRYEHQHFKTKPHYFPQRNETMAALSEATVIVEASDTSGSLTQARAAIKQGRKLFILNSCFENESITWPARFEQQGAIRVKQTSDILEHLT